jgi:hypothetical protein
MEALYRALGHQELSAELGYPTRPIGIKSHNVAAFGLESPPAGSAGGVMAFPYISVGPLRQSRLGRHAVRARARFVDQSRHALRQKPLHPFVDKATADPDGGGHVGNRLPIGDE